MYHILSFIDIVELVQTIPANNAPVCPGRTLQFTCTSCINRVLIGWQFPGQYVIFLYGEDVSPITYNNYTYEIVSETQPPLISTATNEMISSDQDNRLLYCVGGPKLIGRTIDVAGR